MGGTQCTTPSKAMPSPSEMQRLKSMPSTQTLASVNQIPLQNYKKTKESALKNIFVKVLTPYKHWKRNQLFFLLLIFCGCVGSGSQFQIFQDGMDLWRSLINIFHMTLHK